MENESCKMPDENAFFALANLFKIFGDSTRIRILFALLSKEMVVSELASSLQMTDSAISHQLAILKSNRLVKSRREGKFLRYSLDDKHIEEILSTGLAHLNEK